MINSKRAEAKEKPGGGFNPGRPQCHAGHHQDGGEVHQTAVEEEATLTGAGRPSLPFAVESLVLTIHGRCPCAGKTTLQYLISEFLSERGHTVFVSDASAGDSILKPI